MDGKLPALLMKREEDSFYDMANLFPKHTGLPFVVWVSVRGGARHDVRVKVTPGPKAQRSEMISIGLRPSVHVIDGSMEAQDLVLVTRWIELNRNVLLQYWNEQIDTVDLVRSIRPL